MPRKPKKPCSHPGCPELSEMRYCPTHYKAAQSMSEKSKAKRRGTTAERGYGSEWQKIRLQILGDQPFCTFPGCYYFSEEVDHIDADTTNVSAENLRAYCREHHQFKTQKVDLATSQLTWQEFEEMFPRNNKRKPNNHGI